MITGRSLGCRGRWRGEDELFLGEALLEIVLKGLHIQDEEVGAIEHVFFAGEVGIHSQEFRIVLQRAPRENATRGSREIQLLQAPILLTLGDDKGQKDDQNALHGCVDFNEFKILCFCLGLKLFAF